MKPGPLWPAAAALGALAAAGLSVAAPLAAYTVTLAAFGLPHVLSELRYVDRRFGRGLGAPTALRIGGMLALIVAARAAGLAHLLPLRVEPPIELGLVAILALTAARGPAPRIAVAMTLAIAVGLMAIVDPFETTVAFSVLHNLTPLGFLWQIAPAARRPAVMGWAALGFLGLPLLVATGAPRMALVACGLWSPELNPLGAGSLQAQLFVYVPERWTATSHAIDLFTASVVAQQAHYLAVIVVLPLMLARWSPGARGLLPWPRGWWFAAPVAVVAALMLTRFAADFAGSRALYGLFAAAHAWVEIPILIIALVNPQPPIRSPAANEAPLVSSESGIA